METDCVRMRQSYGALSAQPPLRHAMRIRMCMHECGSAFACMNADPGVISTRGSEGKGREKGHMILGLMLRDRTMEKLAK